MTVQMSFVHEGNVLPGRSRVPQLHRDKLNRPSFIRAKLMWVLLQNRALVFASAAVCRPATGCICEAAKEVKLVIIMDEQAALEKQSRKEQRAGRDRNLLLTSCK